MTPALRHLFRGRWRRIAAVAVAAASLGALGMVGSGAVSASSAPVASVAHPSFKTVHFQVRMERTPSGQLQPLKPGQAMLTDDEIIINDCTTQVNYPHVSTHVPENFNVTGTTTCTYPVTESYLTIELFYDGEDYYYGENYLGETVYNQVNAAGPCYSGSWYAVLDYTIYFGPNWTPPDASGELVSTTVSVTC